MIFIISAQFDQYESWDIIIAHTDINAIKQALIDSTISKHYEWLRIEVWENGKSYDDNDEFHTSNRAAGLRYLAQFEGEV